MHLKEFAKLLQRKAGIANNRKHDKSVDWIVAGHDNSPSSVRHNDMAALPDYLKPSAFEGFDRLKVIDPWKFAHQEAKTST